MITVEDPMLRPRNRNPVTGADEGENEHAFLQHDVHAEWLFAYFREHFNDILGHDSAGGEVIFENVSSMGLNCGEYVTLSRLYEAS